MSQHSCWISHTFNVVDAQALFKPGNLDFLHLGALHPCTASYVRTTSSTACTQFCTLLMKEILTDKKLMLSFLTAQEDERAQRVVEHEDVFK